MEDLLLGNSKSCMMERKGGLYVSKIKNYRRMCQRNYGFPWKSDGGSRGNGGTQ